MCILIVYVVKKEVNSMADGKGVAMAILGIVALIAVVGLILLFSGAATGDVVTDSLYGRDKLYGGWDRVQQASPRGAVGYPDTYKGGGISRPYEGTWVKGVPTTWEGQNVAVVGGKQAVYREPSRFTTCPAGQVRVGQRGLLRLTDDEWGTCQLFSGGDGSYCCQLEGLDVYN